MRVMITSNDLVYSANSMSWSFKFSGINLLREKKQLSLLTSKEKMTGLLLLSGVNDVTDVGEIGMEHFRLCFLFLFFGDRREKYSIPY